MADLGQPEINDPNADILVVGRDWGRVEAQQGRSFANKRGAGGILDDSLKEAGLHRSGVNITNVVNTKPPGNNFRAHQRHVVEKGLDNLYGLIDRLDPNLIVALGNVASFALVDGWPTSNDSGDIRDASSIQSLRGYIWEGYDGRQVLTTVHPSAADLMWTPWRALLSMDFRKAREHSRTPALERPTRNVEIIDNQHQARSVVDDLSSSGLLACDIEIWRETKDLACVGFAPSPNQAYVFPARFLDTFAPLLEDPDVGLLGANFQFDVHYLWTRCGVRCQGVADDTQLGFHSRYPELAGKSDTSSGPTRKGLAFLASLYTNDAYWKEDYETEREFYVYNGRDCTITFDVMESLREEIEDFGVEGIYRQEVDLIWPCVAMQERGMAVDEDERQRHLELLLERYDELEDEVNEIVLPYLEERGEERLKDLEIGQSKDAWGLFQRKWTCPCCRNGSKKREHCTDCAGIEGTGASGGILKSDLRDFFESERSDVPEAGLDDLTKSELEELIPPCEVCDGEGQRTWTEMNATSDTQVKAVLYELFKAPKRYNKGSLTSDEVALKNILAEI